jgi:hypothetical protein
LAFKNTLLSVFWGRNQKGLTRLDEKAERADALSAVYQTLQAFMGSYFVNYLHRFARQWQVFIQALVCPHCGEEFVLLPSSSEGGTVQPSGPNCSLTRLLRDQQRQGKWKLARI